MNLLACDPLHFLLFNFKFIVLQVSAPDTVMSIGTMITGGEVAAGAGIGMAGIGVTTIEAGVAAIVQTMIEPAVGPVMMMSSIGAEAVLLKGFQFHLF